jgi:hypothetical protein
MTDIARNDAVWVRRTEPQPCSYWLTIGERQWAVLPEIGGHGWEVCVYEHDGVEFVNDAATVAEGKRIAERDATRAARVDAARMSTTR